MATDFEKELLLRLAARAKTWGGFPNPVNTVESLQTTTMGLKQAVEQLLRSRGDPLDSAMLVRDMSVVFEIFAFFIEGLQQEVSDISTRGESGVGIADVTIDAEGNLIITLTNGTVIDAGALAEAVTKDFFAFYENTGAVIPLPKETWVTLTNNAQGDASTSYLPANVGRLLDPATGALDFSGLAPGDGVIVRPDYTPVSSVNNALLKFRYLLGGGINAYIQERTLGRLDAGSGMGYIQNLLADYIPMLDSNTVDNPVVMQVWLSEQGDVTNNGVAIQVIKG